MIAFRSAAVASRQRADDNDNAACFTALGCFAAGLVVGFFAVVFFVAITRRCHSSEVIGMLPS